MGEHTDSGGLLVLRELGKQFFREIYVQQEFTCMICEAAGSLWVRIAVGNIRLNVKDGCSIHKIRPADMKHSTVLLGMFNAEELHAGQAHMVWPERRPGSIHSYSGVSAKAGRSDSR